MIRLTSLELSKFRLTMSPWKISWCCTISSSLNSLNNSVYHWMIASCLSPLYFYTSSYSFLSLLNIFSNSSLSVSIKITVFKKRPLMFSTSCLHLSSLILRECFSLKIVEMISGNWSLYIFLSRRVTLASKYYRLLLDNS